MPSTHGRPEFYETNGTEAMETCPSRLAAEETASPSLSERRADLTDEQLVRLAQDGDNAAFGDLIQRHHAECMRRAMRVLHNPSDAKDQVQNAYCNAFTNIEKFRGEGKFGAWLSRIVENQCLLTFRKPRVFFLHLETPSAANVQIELISQDMNPEDHLGSQEVIHVLRREICKMPSIMRDVVLLCDLRGLSLSEVASELGISVPAVKSRLSRARLELRSRIAKHVGEKGPATLTERAVYGRTAYASGSASFAAAPGFQSGREAMSSL
jgi:RNA polymerase sigma-70 factor (ECF subfamily)